MQAIILAGGKGTRLHPYTVVFPKPLMPVGDYPILEILIRQLKHYGVTDVTMAVGHLKELIQVFFNDGKNWGLSIDYSFEDKPLGTAAPLKLVDNLHDDFLVMNGDVLSNINFNEFFEFHKKNDAACTIAMYKKKVSINLGVLKTNENNELYDYIEKPDLFYDVSMGIYAFKKEILHHIPDNEYFDFPQLVKKLISEKQKVIGYKFDGYWLDIGTPDDYGKAIEEFNEFSSEFLKD